MNIEVSSRNSSDLNKSIGMNLISDEADEKDHNDALSIAAKWDCRDGVSPYPICIGSPPEKLQSHLMCHKCEFTLTEQSWREIC